MDGAYTQSHPLTDWPGSGQAKRAMLERWYAHTQKQHGHRPFRLPIQHYVEDSDMRQLTFPRTAQVSTGIIPRIPGPVQVAPRSLRGQSLSSGLRARLPEWYYS